MISNPTFRVLAISGIVTSLIAPVWAADIYYDGGDGTWNSTTNWSTDSANDTPNPGAVPGATDTAHFNRSGNNAVNQIITLDAVQSALGLVFSNSGTTTLNGSPGDHGMNLDTGGITVNSGAGAVTIGSNTAGEAMGFVLLNPQTWTHNSSNALNVVNNMTYAGGAGNLTLDGTGTTSTIAGNINSGGLLSIVKNGTGTWTLSGNNVIGGTTINDGTIVANGSGTTPLAGFVIGDGTGAAGSAVLRYDNDDQASTNGGNTINADGVWNLNGRNQTFNLFGVTMNGGTITNTGSGTLTFASGGFTFNSGVNTVQGGNVDLGGNTHPLNVGAGVSAVISSNLGNGALSYAGTGTVTLSGNNTYAGGTTLSLNSGTFNVNSATALGTGTLTFANTGANTTTIDNSSGVAVVNANNNLIAIGTNITFGGSNDLHLGNGAVSVANSATHIYTMNGTATLTLGGDMTYATATNGVQLRGTGVLELLGNSNFTGLLNIRDGKLSIPSVAAAGVNQPMGAGTGTVTLGGTGFTGTLIYTGANGSTDRGFNLHNNAAAGTGAVIDVTSSATTLTLTGVISNGNAAASFTKLGAGTLALTNNNTYVSPTTVTAGTLLINGGAASGNASPITVNGGTLGGSGTIRGAVVVNTATVAPGTTAGTLTVLNALTLNSGSILSFELDGTDLTIGGDVNDLLDQVTNLTLDGTLNVDDLDSFAGVTAGDQWRLINYTGTLVDNTLSLGTVPTLPSGLSFAIDTGTTGQINLVVIPEPTSLALVSLAGVMFLRRRRA